MTQNPFAFTIIGLWGLSKPTFMSSVYYYFKHQHIWSIIYTESKKSTGAD